MTFVDHFFSLSFPLCMFLFVLNLECSEFESGFNRSGLMGFGTGHSCFMPALMWDVPPNSTAAGNSRFLELPGCSSLKTWFDSNDATTISLPPKPNLSLTLTATPDAFITENPANQAKLTLRKDLFSDENGDILFYALLVAIARHTEGPTNGTWNGTYWPNIPNFEWENTSYQVSPAFWNPFGNSDEISYTLGDGTCDNEKRYCNNPLRENTKYTLKVRAFTDSGYQDTDIICFQTLDNLPVSRIVFILGGLLLITAVSVCVSIFNFAEMADEPLRVCKKVTGFYNPAGWIKRIKLLPGKKSRDSFSALPEVYSHKSFLKYSQELLSNPGRVGNEFHLLGTLSSDVSTLCLHAQRVDNKAKNRYRNILPFDMTRVKLSIIDDDPSTDYINASFIRGFKQEIQYIACQGPIEETCHDFYRMIIEQNVGLIVMLTNLMEDGVEKCYKYYPERGEIVKFKDTTITCKEIEDLGICTKRVLGVSIPGRHLTVTQLHLENWRDFECPESPDVLVKLCGLVNKFKTKGYTLVHCSAGAGRTGTFIAVDILLQEIKSNNKISAFNTVLQLRQQRVNMVSTEAQLGLIYKCASLAIEKHLSRVKETV